MYLLNEDPEIEVRAAASPAAGATAAVPASGASSPARMRSSVVFPHPDGPTRTATDPRSTESVAPSSATVPSSKARRTPETVIASGNA